MLGIITSIHDNMQGLVSDDGECLMRFNIQTDVKQGCVLAPILSGIFFFHFLSFAFRQAVVYTYTQEEKVNNSYWPT